MKIAVILYNAPDVEMERYEFDVDDEDPHVGDEIDVECQQQIENWTLAAGDIIKIVEVA